MSVPRNCIRCGKVFTYVYGLPICNDCRKQDEEDFKRVKEYLYDNPGASMSQVASDLGISVKKIKNFLREGRLEIVGDGANMFLECERCGKSIKSGLYCEECERALKEDLTKTASELKKELNPKDDWYKDGKMRYLYRDKK
ncbi:MAG TPA: MerR family transcriptional regulator [Clostridiaceae bacterium]|jgi:flagellar operon protein (TIGR03826 family)|nr:MerR family transcriptional regulator [Clostridiaceae bacterium]